MSVWSYISGIITVEVYGNTQAQSRYVLETVLDHLPVVSGSEQDMSVTIVSPPVIKSQTINRTICVNEFGEKVPGKIFHVEYSPEYHIILDASLRDRCFDRTLRELNKWLNRLAKRVSIKDVLVKVRSWDKSYVISNPFPYAQMEEEPVWYDYILSNKRKDEF